jgi:hypothetical protein
VKTSDASALLAAIDDAIARDFIPAWATDDDGDYSSTSKLWAGVGWLHPVVKSNTEITIGLLGAREHELSKDEYATLHTDFVNMLLMHFDDKFEEATITAVSGDGDEF